MAAIEAWGAVRTIEDFFKDAEAMPKRSRNSRPASYEIACGAHKR